MIHIGYLNLYLLLEDLLFVVFEFHFDGYFLYLLLLLLLDDELVIGFLHHIGVLDGQFDTSTIYEKTLPLFLAWVWSMSSIFCRFFFCANCSMWCICSSLLFWISIAILINTQKCELQIIQSDWCAFEWTGNIFWGLNDGFHELECILIELAYDCFLMLAFVFLQ